MEKLRARLEHLVELLPTPEILRSQLDELVSVYPFNEYEFLIAHLLAANVLSLPEYYELRNGYIERNFYLYLFEMSAPRSFGEMWAQGHLKELVPTLQKPTKQLDPKYIGDYDFWLAPTIRIEVKASRAVAFDAYAPLYVKALSSDSLRPFDMNFQQIKPAHCDVFVWLAVWRDIIKHWVLPSYDVENSRFYSRGQHRGNVGEGQLHLTHDNIHEFDRYLVEARELEDAIRAAYREEMQQRGK
jgi:hypothetical protein